MKDGFVWCPHCRRPHLLTERVCQLTGRAIDRTLHRHARIKHPIIGTLLGGKYEIIQPIARGGVGVIFEAEDRALHRRVAIKIVTDAQARESARRLEREAILVAGITHPNVCVVFDIGRLPDDSPYFVMERLYGETLAESLRRDGPLDPPHAVDVMLQVLAGLEAAHNERVIHRDLKPSNLFLVDCGSQQPRLLKLLDFGYAKKKGRPSMLPADPTALTSPGSAVGTPRYMAPEIVRGETASIASDIFSCGVILFEMLSGHRPFGGSTAIEVAEAILAGRPRDLDEVSKHPISTELKHVVLTALSLRREDRFQSARAMRRALSAASKVRLHPGDSARLRAAIPQSPSLDQEGPASSSSSSSKR